MATVPSHRACRFSLPFLGWLCLGFAAFGLLSAGPLWAAENEAVAPAYHKPAFWDGEWTEATSGYHWSWPDAGQSDGKSGTKEHDKCQQYYTPNKVPYEDMDLETYKDYDQLNYTPYAVGAIGYDFYWGKKLLRKGIYQAKLGPATGGSLNTHLGKGAVGQALILFQAGKVVAVFALQPVLPATPPPPWFNPTTTVRNHSQWGPLTARENWRARLNESFVRPTLQAALVADDPTTMEMTLALRHGRYRATAKAAQPAF